MLNNAKKMITIFILVSLLITIIPIQSAFAEETAAGFYGGESTIAIKSALVNEVPISSMKNGSLKMLSANPIANGAIIEGYLSIYLGDAGTGLNTLVLNNLNQLLINASLRDMKFILKRNDADIGIEYLGTDVFIPDLNWNLAVKDANNRLTGRFRITTTDFQYTILRIYNTGYLARQIDITLAEGQMFVAGTADFPIEIYPGDIGRIGNGLELLPDDTIDNIDFSAWLKIYKDSMEGTANAYDIYRADFSKDASLDNIDFSLWLASYKKAKIFEEGLVVTGVSGTNLKELVVTFNNELDPAKVVAASFMVDGANVASVALDADKKNVTVSIDADKVSSTNGAYYALAVKKEIGLEEDFLKTVRVIDCTLPVVTGVILTGPKTFDIKFSEPLENIAGIVKVNNGIYGIISAVIVGNTVTCTLAAASLPDGNYTISISGYRDFAGFIIDAADKTLVYANDPAIIIASITSASQSRVIVTFNKAVTLTAPLTSYFYNTFNVWVPDIVTTVDNKSYILTFTTYPLPEGMTNLVVKCKGDAENSEIIDERGNKLTANISLTVMIIADKTAPTVTMVEVTDEKTVAIKFSESMNTGTARIKAEDEANFTVKDSSGVTVSTAFTASYTENPASGIYQVKLIFASGLPAGNYTIEVKNLEDIAFTPNVMTAVTLNFATADLTPVDPADVVVIGVESYSANTPDKIYVCYPEKMAATGQYSVFSSSNYLFAGAVLPPGTTLESFGSTGRIVKISIPDGTKQTIIPTVLTIGRVADFAGNTTTALSFNCDIRAEVAPVVTAVKQTDYNKITVIIDKPLSEVTVSGLKAGAHGAVMIMWYVNSDNQTVINAILSSQGNALINDTSSTIASFEIIGNELVTETGTKMAGANYSGLIKDYRAPRLIATNPIVAGIASSTIAIKFTEGLDTNATSLMANDLVVVNPDGISLIAGLGFTTTLATTTTANDTLIVSLTGPLAISGTYKVSSKAALNYIRDAAAGINNIATPFITPIDVSVLFD